MNVLLAEDDRKLGRFLTTLLTGREVNVDWIDNGGEIEYYAREGDYDLLLLDWMLPGKSGVDACRALRAGGYQGGIIILTARAALTDKLAGLNCGADDYLVKPFDFEELFARMKALCRRLPRIFQADVFNARSLRFDCLEKTITAAGRAIRLTAREFQVAELLARNAGQIISREIIISRVWGDETETETADSSLDTYIKLLRKKLEAFPGKKFIKNIRSVGYRWEEEDV